MPDDDSVQIELDEGELITMPAAGENHGHLETDLATELAYFVKKHKLGRVYAGDTGFRLNDRTVLAPDVAFVRQERVAAVRSKSFVSAGIKSPSVADPVELLVCGQRGSGTAAGLRYHPTGAARRR